MVDSCEILIVGAGPAGSAAALAAARLGLETVLIEKKRMPRYKCCAGGVPAKVAADLRLDFSEVPREKVSGAVFSWKGADVAEAGSEELLGWVVDRAVFDDFLARAAAAAGARLIEETEVVGLEENGAGVTAATAAGPVRARAAVVATGASSKLSRVFSASGSRGRGFGLEARVVPPAPVWERYRSRLHFDFGAVVGGYSWIFPGPGFLNVGAASRRARAPRLPLRLREYLVREGLEGWAVSSRFRGASLSAGYPRTPLVRGRCLLAGDAAALTDALTGEGIYPAVLSGRLAAETVAAHVREGGALEEYPAVLREKLGNDLVWGRRLARALDAAPRLIYRRTISNPARARKMMEVGMGRCRYSELFGSKKISKSPGVSGIMGTP